MAIPGHPESVQLSTSRIFDDFLAAWVDAFAWEQLVARNALFRGMFVFCCRARLFLTGAAHRIRTMLVMHVDPFGQCADKHFPGVGA